MKNVKSAFFIIALLFINHEISSQNLVGVAGGYNLTFPYSNSDPHFHQNFTPLSGYSISAFYKFRSEHKINLATELMFIQERYKNESSYGGLGGSITFDTRKCLNNIRLSPFLEYKIGNKGKFNVGLGTSIGYVISESDEGSSFTVFHNHTHYTTIYTDQETNFKPFFDLRGLIRTGFEMPLNNNLSLALDGSCSIGLFNNSEKLNSPGNLDFKTIDLLFQAGLMFKLGRNKDKAIK